MLAGPPHPGSIRLERLGPAHLLETFAWLDQDPVLHVYLLALLLADALGQPRDEFWAARRDGGIVALLYLGGASGAVLPVGDDPEALEALADRARHRLELLPARFQLIGTADAVAPFHRHFLRAGLMPRLDRSQVYMVLERDALPPIAGVPELAPAGPADHALVHESGALLRMEELEEDPRETDPSAYKRRVDDECRDGHTYLWRAEDGALLFRASVSARTADAAQISGVYTPPEFRGRKLATRGLAELCRRMFERSGAVSLFVNDFNLPALALYRRLRFADRARWRSSFYGGA